MAIVKSFSVGDGDMFAIQHNTDNFTIIDCCLNDDNYKEIMQQLRQLKRDKGIFRFISTHPDEDHIHGLELIDEKFGIPNFYCVKNQANKEDKTKSFKKYCELRDSKKAFYIHKDCKRRWLNQSDEERKLLGAPFI